MALRNGKPKMTGRNRFSDESGDECMKLLQRVLYLDPLTRPVSLDTQPRDGSEFIYIQRLLDAELSYSLDEKLIEVSDDDSTKVKDHLIYWRKRRAKEFMKLVKKLNADKEILKEKFPKTVNFPVEEEEWCLFCLGFELCSQIYDTKNMCTDIEEGYPPNLSIVLHLTQEEILLLLKYHLKWLKVIGMHDKISRWIYALFACLKKPVNTETNEFLKNFLKLCKPYHMACEESQKGRVNLIVAIIENYFMFKRWKKNS